MIIVAYLWLYFIFSAAGTINWLYCNTNRKSSLNEVTRFAACRMALYLLLHWQQSIILLHHLISTMLYLISSLLGFTQQGSSHDFVGLGRDTPWRWQRTNCDTRQMFVWLQVLFFFSVIVRSLKWDVNSIFLCCTVKTARGDCFSYYWQS